MIMIGILTITLDDYNRIAKITIIELCSRITLELGMRFVYP